MSKSEEESLERKATLVYERMCRVIGADINRIREEKGISLREMYRRTNISIAVLSAIENGNKLPRIETLVKIILALEIPLSNIFSQNLLLEYAIKEIKLFKPTKEELLKCFPIRFDLSKDEMKELYDYMEYIKFKRNKKSKS